MEFSAIVEELTKSEAAEDRDVNFGRHERTPGEGPPLFHATEQEGERRRNDHMRPGVQSGGTHGASCAAVDRRNGPHAVVRGDDQRPDLPMTTTKSIAASVCPNHNRANGTQQTLGSV